MFIKANKLSQHFKISKTTTHLSILRLLFGRGFSTKTHIVKAVDEVSLDIKQGEKIGIIGHNGAGKTTLLQMVAGMLKPTSGKIEVKGHVNCVMTLGVGLREDLSGRENIYIDGEINGKIRAEIDEFIENIINFVDIGEFIDYPVRTYSSGMKARLAFSMIIYINPEILLIDEALSAGDANFNRKAIVKIKEIIKKGYIHIIVSHSLNFINQMCERCICLDQGKVIMDGTAKEVTQSYVELVRERDELLMQKKFKKRIRNISFSDAFEIFQLYFVDSYGKQKAIFEVGEEMTICFTITCKKQLERPDFKIFFMRTDGILLSENMASKDGFETGPLHGINHFEILIGPIFFGKNTYEVLLELLDKNLPKEQVIAFRKVVLKVENNSYPHNNPLFFHPVKWNINKEVKIN